jgi:sterol desaturase/sphingolipid hydroxylase (fatty acid hydroxylase superfamily)
VTIATGILNAGLSFLALFLMLRPLELAYPARKGQRFFRPQWFTDLCFLLGQYLCFNGAVLWLLVRAQPWLRAATPQSISNAVAGLNWWLQAPLVILLGDFIIYWGHRLQHRVGFLWRFHSIHHSAEHLDWLAAHREHLPRQPPRLRPRLSNRVARVVRRLPGPVGRVHPFERPPADRPLPHPDRRARAAPLAP